MVNEKRLIDAVRYREVLDRYINAPHVKMGCSYSGGMSTAIGTCISFLDNQPTVDAVEVVRCKDCKYYEIHKPKVLENCERNGLLIPMGADDFCSYGERREGE